MSACMIGIPAQGFQEVDTAVQGLREFSKTISDFTHDFTAH